MATPKPTSTSAPAVGPPSLTFPRTTFAKLSPHPFLLAHLQPPDGEDRQEIRRPNGRILTESRSILVNKGSLTHASGSAVVRVGDTACVCGVRGEVLYVRDIPGGRRGGARKEEIRELGLLVPNVELSTGCSPAHLPGQAPGSLAQTLARRLQALLYTSNLISAEDLRITYRPPTLIPDEEMRDPDLTTDDDDHPEEEVKAYWTLYIDILFISLDGPPFDTAWASLLAALSDTKLPRAWWDVDRQLVLCDDRVDQSRRLTLRGFPIAWSAAVYSTPRGRGKWVLADPDAFEEGICREGITVVVDCGEGGRARILSLEKVGGGAVGKEDMREIVGLATERWGVWREALRGG